MKLDDPELLERPIQQLMLPARIHRLNYKSYFCEGARHHLCLVEDCHCACHTRLAASLHDHRQAERDAVVCLHQTRCIIADCHCHCHSDLTRLNHEINR